MPTDRDQLSSELWRVGPPTDGTTAITVSEGFRVASFRSARHVVFIVSSLNDHDLHEVATAIGGPVSNASAAPDRYQIGTRDHRPISSRRGVVPLQVGGSGAAAEWLAPAPSRASVTRHGGRIA